MLEWLWIRIQPSCFLHTNDYMLLAIIFKVVKQVRILIQDSSFLLFLWLSFATLSSLRWSLHYLSVKYTFMISSTLNSKSITKNMKNKKVTNHLKKAKHLNKIKSKQSKRTKKNLKRKIIKWKKLLQKESLKRRKIVRAPNEQKREEERRPGRYFPTILMILLPLLSVAWGWDVRNRSSSRSSKHLVFSPALISPLS